MSESPSPAFESGPEGTEITMEPLRVDKDQFSQKWGLWNKSFVQIPSLLIEHKNALEITDSELVLLLVLINHWWDSAKMPFPSVKRIADYMGKTERSIQRLCQQLENNTVPVEMGWAKYPGYIKRVKREGAQVRKSRSQRKDGTAMGVTQKSNLYDISPLVRVLKNLEYDLANRQADLKASLQRRQTKMERETAPKSPNRNSGRAERQILKRSY